MPHENTIHVHLYRKSTRLIPHNRCCSKITFEEAVSGQISSVYPWQKFGTKNMIFTQNDDTIIVTFSLYLNSERSV